MTSRTIRASRDEVYAAFLDPDVLVRWLPPAPMTGRMHSFDARVGGGYRMSLYYPETEAQHVGKTAEREDLVHVTFAELLPTRRIVELVHFESDDASFAGTMTLTITFEEVRDGTEVTMAFDGLPPGLRPEDNDEGARLSLAQLARCVEPGPG